MKKIISILAAAALIFSVFAFAGCETEEASAQNVSFVSLRINPEVEFTVNEDNTVSEVNPVNEDADIILADIDLVGMELEDAAEIFVDAATEGGYIDEESEDNEVNVDVISEETDEQEDIMANITDRLNKHFKNKGINAKISEEEYEELQAEAEALGITVQKLRLIEKAIELNPELVKEDLTQLSISELVDMVRTKFSKFDFGSISGDFKTERIALHEKYEELGLYTLHTELEELNAQLEAFSGTDEEKAELEADILAKQTEYDALKAEFETEMQALTQKYKEIRQEYKEQLKSEKAEMKQLISEKRAQMKGKAQAEKEQAYQEIKQQKEQIKQQLKECVEDIKSNYEQKQSQKGKR